MNLKELLEAILLLAGAGFAIWKIFLATPEEDADIPDWLKGIK